MEPDSDTSCLECAICRDYLTDAVRIETSPIPYCRACIRMWLLMAPTPARRVCPLSGAPCPPGAPLIPDPALTARAAAARAAAAAAVEPGMCVQIGEYIFDSDGTVLGRVSAPAPPPPDARRPATPPLEEEAAGVEQPRHGGLLAKLAAGGGKRRRVAVTAATGGVE